MPDNVIGSAYIAIRPQAAGFESALASGLAGPLGRMESTFGKVGKVGAMALGGIGVAAGAAGLEALKMAGSFQQQMTLIRTQASDTTDNLDVLGKQLLNLAGQVGQTPEELAKGFYHLASAGFTGKQALDMLTQGAKLAAVGQSDMQTTMQAVIFTMRAGLPDIHNATDAVAMLNAIVGTGDMRMSQLAEAMSSGIMPVAAQFGVSLQSLGAALAFMTDRGVPANEATTRLRMSIALLGAPTKVAAKLLTDAGVASNEASYRVNAMTEALHLSGVSTTQLTDDLRKPDGIMVALQDLKQHFTDAGVSIDMQNATLSRAFGGGKSGGTIMMLYGQLDLLKQKYDQIGKATSNFAADWAEQQKTLTQKTADFHGAMDALVITLGNKLLPVGTAVVTFLGDVAADLGGTTTATSGADSAARSFADGLKIVVGDLGHFGQWMADHKEVIGAIGVAFAGWKIGEATRGAVSNLQKFFGVGQGAISAAMGQRVFVTNMPLGGLGGGGIGGGAVGGAGGASGGVFSKVTGGGMGNLLGDIGKVGGIIGGALLAPEIAIPLAAVGIGLGLWVANVKDGVTFTQTAKAEWDTIARDSGKLADAFTPGKTPQAQLVSEWTDALKRTGADQADIEAFTGGLKLAMTLGMPSTESAFAQFSKHWADGDRNVFTIVSSIKNLSDWITTNWPSTITDFQNVTQNMGKLDFSTANLAKIFGAVDPKIVATDLSLLTGNIRNAADAAAALAGKLGSTPLPNVPTPGGPSSSGSPVQHFHFTLDANASPAAHAKWFAQEQAWFAKTGTW